MLCALNKTGKTSEQYFDKISKCPIVTLVKLIDRVNNLQSMKRGGFTIGKQKKYVEEVKTYFLPMAKRVRLNHPKMMDAFYNVETMLKHQVEFAEMFIEAMQ